MTFNSKLSLALMAAGFSVSFSAYASAACVTGDCAAMGYNKTESACSGDIIRCPFDTSKVFCKEKPNIKIGMIYYSDGTFSNDIIAAKTPIGVVAYLNGANGLIIALEEKTNNTAWGGEGHNVTCLTDYNDNANLDKNGRANTLCLSSSDSQSHPAAIYCHNFKASTTGIGSNGWYLPAAGELAPILLNINTINATLTKLNKTKINDMWYKSSTEYNENYTWLVRISNIMNYAYGKNGTYYSVRCVTNF